MRYYYYLSWRTFVLLMWPLILTASSVAECCFLTTKLPHKYLTHSNKKLAWEDGKPVGDGTRSSSITLYSSASSSSNNNKGAGRSTNDGWTPFHSWSYVGFHNHRHRRRTSTRTHHHRSSSRSRRRHNTVTSSIRAKNVGGMPDGGGGLSPCLIKVVGVGGAGGNAVDRMLETTSDSSRSENGGVVEFYTVNTDAQVLARSKKNSSTRGTGAINVLHIGNSVTRGLGAGGDPETGRMAAQESREEIRDMLEGTDLCFVTAGMGGGTGSGAAPIVAEVAKKQCDCLTVGIVTKPFAFEGRKRMNQALEAVENLREHVDTVIIVSNDRLLEIIPDDTPLERAFAVADDILRQGVVGISDIIVKPGLINVDFADVRQILRDSGTALMGIGIAHGRNAAEDAAMAAISSPLLDTTIDNAQGVVFNICGGPNLTLNEVNQAARLIYNFVAPDANVIFGALVDESLGDNISITVLATGFDVDLDKGSLQRTAQKNHREDDNFDVDENVAPKNTAATAPRAYTSSSATPTKNRPGSIPPFLRTLKKKN